MRKWHNPAERPQFVAVNNLLYDLKGVLTVGEWAVLVKCCLSTAIEVGAPMHLDDSEVMHEMDILTDAEGIGGWYPICDECGEEMVRDCTCPICDVCKEMVVDCLCPEDEDAEH